ncbi:trinucleotide repeat-containing gene 6C protein-like isoform X3 [Xenia sp. Carnegie-2017]|uniref:trinucleotide repeat-containing gene 6C protein-like isoform X3 n=1 Tax=Xenia sp. Carnegie-2017 TaxID=2897299 RepID=UPI001F04D926|nr:trinucleotide repeat-containing gene 6C protein-like isoform X3 [Xenia sp. Carnegie-2017]
MPKDERQRSLDVLGLARNCTKNEIRLAYFKRLLHCFPDADDDSVKSSSDNLRLVAVSQAYCNLSDVFDPEDVDTEEVFFKFLQEIFKDESGQLFHVLLQEHEATMCADDEYRCDEDDYDVDIKRDFDKLVAVLKNYKRNGSEIPDELTEEKVFKYRDNLLRLREDSKKDSKKSSKKGKTVQNPVAKPKPKSKKQLLAEQRRREKEMANIAVELEKKKKEDEEKEKVRKQLEVEKQKRLEEERKKSEAEARRQREREQKERERLQKLEQEREKKQKEEEERRKKEELKRKKLEQERIEKEKLEKAAKIKAAQTAKEKEEQAKNINKNQNIKRNLTQRSDQTYPREIPPRFQRMSRMKQQQQTTFPQQQMSSVSPVLQQQSVSSTATTATTVYPSQGMSLTKPVAKPAPPIVGKKKDQERWTKGDYTGIIEDVQDDAGWSNAPPAVSTEDWDDTSEDWGYEVTSLEDKPADDERVIVDKTDQDSWPSVQGKDEKEGFVSDEKENKSTFGDTLDAVIDGLEAAEMNFNGKWNKDGATDNIKSSNDFMNEVVDVDSMSKVHGKDLRQIVERSSENPLQNPSSGWKDSNLKKTSDTTSSDLQQNPSVWKTKTYVDWPDKPEVGDNWKGYSGGKSELPEETGWGESNVNKSVNNKNWNASLSAQGLSITGTEIWDQASADTKGSGDTGNDWTAQDKSGNEDSRWDSVRQYENSNWGTSLSSAGSMRNKQNLGYDENAWLRRSLKQLVDMGFKEADGEKALKSNNMSLEGAIGQLLATQGTPSMKQSSIATLLPSEFNVNAESTSSQTDNNEDVTKLKLSQQQNLMSQNLAPEALKNNDEPSTDPSKTSAYVVPSVTSTSVSESARSPALTDQRSLEYLKESDDLRSDKIATSGNMCIPGNQDNSRPLSSTGSSGVGNLPTVQTSLPVVYQQQLLQQQQQQQQQQVQMQQLRFAHASRLMRNSLASQPVILLQQLAQLRIVQQQLATQQQLLQKQPQTNSMQVQQVAVQQQQIAAMMQQIQQQLLQQQLQQQTQQQLTSGQFSTPQQETLLNAQPQLQQLLLQRKQQQQQQLSQQQLSQQHRKQTPLNHQAELSDESKDVSSRSNFSKEAVSSLVQAVNSAPASPSTGKSRLGQWTQNSIQPERTSPSLPDGGSARNNLRSSPQPDSSPLISRSTNSPSSSQTSSSSAPGHRVIDPVSSRWGIDAAPKLSAEPPEFKPGVPWKSLQGKDDMVGDISLTSSKIVDWSSSSNQTVSSAFVPITTRNNIPSLNPSSNSQNFSQANQAAIWPSSVSRNTTSQKQNSLSSNIRPPPGLGNDNSFHNISNVHSRSNNDSSWGSRNESQINNTSQFGIRTPGLQTWSNERREVGWPGTSGQPLESQPSVARVSSDLRDLSILGETIIDGNGVSMGSKPGLPSSYSNISTWLVMRNVNPLLDSNALRTLCQQHGRLLTFRLNSRNGNCLLRYDNKDEAAKAHGNLNGLPIAGLRLSVDFASDSDIGSFFEQNSDWTWPNAHASLPKTQTITEWPASKPLLPAGNFSSELWSYSQAGGLASGSGVWSAAPSSRLDGEQSTGMPENGLTSPSMVTFLPPGLLNSSESN